MDTATPQHVDTVTASLTERQRRLLYIAATQHGWQDIARALATECPRQRGLAPHPFFGCPCHP